MLPDKDFYKMNTGSNAIKRDIIVYLLKTVLMTGFVSTNAFSQQQTNKQSELFVHWAPFAKLSPDVQQKTQEARQRAEQAFDFKTGHFKQGITEPEKQQLYNDLLDSLVTTDDEYYRFDRTEKQTFINEAERKKQLLTLQQLANRCVEYINNDPNYKRQSTTASPINYSLPDTDDAKEIMANIQLVDLQDKVQTCSTFIYGNNYNLNDFEYYDYTQPKNALYRKKQMLWALYEDLYMTIRRSGLIRQIPAAYYPKSLLVQHANKFNLTDYIQLQQEIMHQPLNHQKLAIDFFGSYSKWFKSLNAFLDDDDPYIKLKDQFLMNDTIKKWRCGSEKGKLGIPVLYKNIHGVQVGAHPILVYFGGVKCARQLTPAEILDFKDKRYTRMAKYLKFDNIRSKFIEGTTALEKEQFLKDYNDLHVETLAQLYRFYRENKQPIGTSVPDDTYQLLDQCASAINKPIYNSYDDDYYDPLIATHTTSTDVINIHRWSRVFHELDGKVKQCATYLYGENYTLTNFEYPEPTIINTPEYNKRLQVEQLYEQAYLLMKAAGILPRVPAAFYPKSLVRKHADKTGLTHYIQTQQHQLGQVQDHQALAIEYFKSRANWMKSLDEFIQ